MAALGRLDGVKDSKAGRKASLYTLEVKEKTAILPSAVEKVLKGLGYELKGLWMDAVGKVEKKGGTYIFTARGSKKKYDITLNEKMKDKLSAKIDELIKDGKSTMLLGGIVTEPKPPDGVDVTPPPNFAVGAVKTEDGK